MDTHIDVPVPSLMERAQTLLADRIGTYSPENFATAYFDTRYGDEQADAIAATGVVLDLLRSPAPLLYTIPAAWPATLAWPPAMYGRFYRHTMDRDINDLMRNIDGDVPNPSGPLADVRDRLLALTALELDGSYPSRQIFITWTYRDDYAETVLGLSRSNLNNVTFAREDWFHAILRSCPWLRTIGASSDKPDMVRFYATLADAQKGRHSEMRVGRFLTRYKVGVPAAEAELTEDRIREIAETQHKAMATNYSDEAQYMLTFGEERHDFRHAYVNGPQSCMSSDFGNLDCHPAEVYASGDFAIATLTPVDDPDKVIARCVVRPGKLAHSTVYPNPNSWHSDSPRLFLSGIQAQAAKDELERRLAALGYDRDEDTHDFRGGRLLRMPVGYSDCEFMAPYLDNGYAVSDDGDHLILERDGYGDGAHPGTGGTVQLREIEYCDACGGDSYGDLEDVYTDTSLNGTRGRGCAQWCEHCRDHDAFYCDAIGGMVSNELHGGDMVTRTRGYDGRSRNGNMTVNQNYLERNAFFCEWMDNYYRSSDFTQVDISGATVCLEANVNVLFWCRYNEAFFGVEDEHQEHDGFHADTSFRDRALARMREVTLHGAPALMQEAA